VKYREMNLAEKLKTMSEEEQLALLASDGLLVKRPILVTAEGKVIPGFKAETWSAALGK
jgi:arsenate reductase